MAKSRTPWEIDRETGEKFVSIPDICGASWWGALEGVVKAINCSTCREHGLKLLSAMHDLVNLETRGELHDRENFIRVAKEYEDWLMQLTQGVMGRFPGNAYEAASGENNSRFPGEKKKDYAAERRTFRSSRSSSRNSSSVNVPFSMNTLPEISLPETWSNSLSPEALISLKCSSSQSSISVKPAVPSRKLRITSANSSRMAQDLPRVYRAEQIIRERFNSSPLPELIQQGRLQSVVRQDRLQRQPQLMGEPIGTRHLYIRYLDQDGNFLLEVSQFVRPDGTLGASGRPDPKAIRVGNEIWDSRARRPLHNNPYAAAINKADVDPTGITPGLFEQSAYEAAIRENCGDNNSPFSKRFLDHIRDGDEWAVRGMLEAAFRDWLSNSVFVDARGTYRYLSSKRKTSWSDLVRKRYIGVEAFSRAANQWGDEQGLPPDSRDIRGFVPRIIRQRQQNRGKMSSEVEANAYSLQTRSASDGRASCQNGRQAFQARRLGGGCLSSSGKESNGRCQPDSARARERASLPGLVHLGQPSPVLLDTNALSVLTIRDHTLAPLYSNFLLQHPVVTTLIAVAENLRSLHNLPSEERDPFLRTLWNIPRLDLREDIATFWAALRELARSGPSDNDIWMAAFAMSYDIPLVSHDFDLVKLDGVTIEGRTLRIFSHHLHNLEQPPSAYAAAFRLRECRDEDEDRCGASADPRQSSPAGES